MRAASTLVRGPAGRRRKPAMKPLPTLRLIALAALLPLASTPLLAQSESYFYGGLALGQSRARIDQERIAANLGGIGLATTGFTRDERGSAFRVFGGWQANRWWGVEAGYFDLGRFGFQATTAPAGTLDGKIRIQGLNLDLVATLPLTERLSLLGRAGVQSARSRDDFSGTGAVFVTNPNPSARSTNPKLGVGLQYAFSPGFLMRAEAERLRVDDAVGRRGNVNVLALSLVFPFGRSEATRTTAAAPWVAPEPLRSAAEPAPPPAAAAPRVAEPPAPVLAAAAPAPRRRVSFLADALFGFDESELKPEGKAALDRFVAELRGTRFEFINVEGHADRIGTRSYNQALSQQRADTVKTYLVNSGVDATKVNAVGKGESDPVDATGACQGEKATARLKACLQPDRRVDIEVTGTQR
jgi:OOP family OmpA-OmpF porin